jgi:hypothetical protein
MPFRKKRSSLQQQREEEQATTPPVPTPADWAAWAAWLDTFEANEAAALWQLATDPHLLTIAAQMCEKEVSPTLLAHVRALRKNSTLLAIREQAERLLGGRFNTYRSPQWARETAQDDPAAVAAGGFVVIPVALSNQMGYTFVPLERAEAHDMQACVEHWVCQVTEEGVRWELVFSADTGGVSPGR